MTKKESFNFTRMGFSEPCIYRVPSRMREVKPEAYTPRMVLIGPLHHSAKPIVRIGRPEAPYTFGPILPIAANVCVETVNNPWHQGEKMKKKYQRMEEQKKTYLECFTAKVGEENVEEMRKTIKTEEHNIRASYADSIDWISSEFLVDLILHDSVFIVEFIIRLEEYRGCSGDLIVDHPFYTSTVISDLIMLENQLPYFIFDKLFSPNLKALCIYTTLDRLILELFSLHTKIKRNTNFMHFTDMFRCVYEESLYKTSKMNYLSGPALVDMQNADNLSRVGVEFKAFDLLTSSIPDGIHRQFTRSQRSLSVQHSMRNEVDDYSLHVEFDKGRLVMSTFRADEASDSILRNVIAYEQCHVALTPFTSNYIHFINFLITNDRDVEVLTAEEVLTNGMGRPSLVVEMVNKLKVGVDVAVTSQYHGIVMNLKAHYKSRRKRCWANLNKVYFSDLWTGTASTAAVLLLVFTLISTVATVIQTYKSFKPTE